jgi:hypothetical protein
MMIMVRKWMKKKGWAFIIGNKISPSLFSTVSITLAFM